MPCPPGLVLQLVLRLWNNLFAPFSQAEEILPKVNSHELCTKFKVDLVSQFYFPDGGKAFGVAQSNFQENLPKECL